jgi:hypothetical protein
MLLSNVLFFATAVLAAPAATVTGSSALEGRQQRTTVASTILQVVTTLEQTTNTNIDEIIKSLHCNMALIGIN